MLEATSGIRLLDSLKEEIVALAESAVRASLTKKHSELVSTIRLRQQQNNRQSQTSFIFLISDFFHLPPGAIFDETSVQIRSAFSWELTTVNSNQRGNYRVKLNANSQRTRVNDSFSLTSTSK